MLQLRSVYFADDLLEGRSRDFVGGDRRVLWKFAVMVKKVKQPKQARDVPSPSKQPRIAVDPNSYYQKRPSWRVAKMEGMIGYGSISLNC